MHLVFESLKRELIALFKTSAVLVEDESGFLFLDDEQYANNIAILDKAPIIFVWRILTNLFLIIFFDPLSHSQLFLIIEIDLFAPDGVKRPQLKVVFGLGSFLILETYSNE